MYVYIFEDGTTQAHDTGPTEEDVRCVKEGLLTIITFDEERRALQLDPDGGAWDWLALCGTSVMEEGPLCHIPT